MIEREQPLAAAPPLVGSPLPKLRLRLFVIASRRTTLSKSARPHPPHLGPGERQIKKPLSLVLGLGFMSQTKELFRNVAILFGCGHAVLPLPFRQPIVQGYM